MLENIATGASHIYLSCGVTDFRKQIEGLTALVSLKFKLDPYDGASIFIFCNKRHNSIKVLRWDNNGFVLVTKKLVGEMKFQWPKSSNELHDISQRELDWLLQGLSIHQPKAHKTVKIPSKISF
jgi:transposase